MSFVVTVALAAVAAAPARATTVELRVEAAGAPAPLFAGPVTTGPHPVDGGDGSGAHPCSGPVGATPGATATGALDDAMRAAGIPWRGNWDPSFRDFFIERIGAYASRAPDEYWSLTVDGRYAPGGCQAALAEGDEVRFFYGPLFGEGPGTQGGSAAVGGGAATVPGGEAAPSAPSPAVSAPARPGRLAAAAARYLRRHREGAGEVWSRLALAVRSAGGLRRKGGDRRGGTPRRVGRAPCAKHRGSQSDANPWRTATGRVAGRGRRLDRDRRHRARRGGPGCGLARRRLARAGAGTERRLRLPARGAARRRLHRPRRLGARPRGTRGGGPSRRRSSSPPPSPPTAASRPCPAANPTLRAPGSGSSPCGWAVSGSNTRRPPARPGSVTSPGSPAATARSNTPRARRRRRSGPPPRPCSGSCREASSCAAEARWHRFLRIDR